MGETITALLAQHAPTWLLQMPGVLDTAQIDALHNKIGAMSQDRMLREMTEALEALSQRNPLVLILEDVHWSDSATIDLLDFLSRRQEPASLLVIATYRPADVIINEHPLKAQPVIELAWHEQTIAAGVLDSGRRSRVCGAPLSGRCPER
ncbi:MAG: ATP-binding protein [Candidatus Competibacteraceae bacterium]